MLRDPCECRPPLKTTVSDPMNVDENGRQNVAISFDVHDFLHFGHPGGVPGSDIDPVSFGLPEGPPPPLPPLKSERTKTGVRAHGHARAFHAKASRLRRLMRILRNCVCRRRITTGIRKAFVRGHQRKLHRMGIGDGVLTCCDPRLFVLRSVPCTICQICICFLQANASKPKPCKAEQARIADPNLMIA